MFFIRKNLANFITLLNLFLGFAGVIQVLYHDEIMGCYLLFAAAFLDLLDGYVARLTGTVSETGRQLDSFADLVSFGLLPSMILHALLLRSHHPWVYTITWLDVPLPSYLPFIVLAGAAIRLAKFNINTGIKYHFRGLPTPAAGIFIASLPLIIRNDLFVFGYNTFYLEKVVLNSYVLILTSIIICLLMVSRIPLFSLKFSSFSFSKNYHRYILILLFVLFFFFFYYLSIPLIICFYLLLSLILKKKIIAEN